MTRPADYTMVRMITSVPRASALVAALALAASPAVAQVLQGIVVDSATGQPVAGAHVSAFSVADTKVGDTVTDYGGHFTFHLPAVGAYVLLVERLGYATTGSQLISVGSTVEATARLRLIRLPVALDTVTVVGDAGVVGKRLPWLADVGFYDRRRKGFGYFLTREDIESKDPLIMSDVLKGLPGIRVTCGGPLSCRITMPAATTMFLRGKCQASVVLDGVVLRVGGTGNRGDLTLDNLLNPFDVEAVEVYPSAAGVPVQWGGYVSPCGAIVAWSRR